MSDSLPPPIYSQRDPDQQSASNAEPIVVGDPQILIIPSGDSVNFQKGYLGAEGERAAIEGELQIKTTQPDRWNKVTISLRIVERAADQEIELAALQNVLYTRTPGSIVSFPLSFPFAIPLQVDAPQSIRTSNSSLSYLLTATLFPSDPLLSSHSKTLTVHTRRFISHSHVVPVHPETHTLEDPTHVQVQVPRITFVAGESIPVYVTVPSPAKELVLDRGLRLRNIQVELVRNIEVDKDDADGSVNEVSVSRIWDRTEPQVDGPSTMTQVRSHATAAMSKAPLFSTPSSSSHREIVARSGASCRFHSSRPVKLRFLLNYPVSQRSPSSLPSDLPSVDCGTYDGEECPSITQLTILHSITFCLVVHVSFVDITARRENISTITIPITILAPPAPLPEVSPEIDAAYSKKHDRPPLKTVRQDDVDHPIPHYSEGEAGPSILPSSAPPPFEERDAPPPFTLNDSAESSSTRLPTFLESEEEIIIPNEDPRMLEDHQRLPTIIGEGIDFGFLSSDQFDGHTELIQDPMTPPPTLEMASRDTDLTDLVDISGEPEITMEVLGLALDHHEEPVIGDRPPPPPAMDDPSDPPPSIDSDFRSREMPRQPHAPLTEEPPSFSSEQRPIASSEREPVQAHAYAPPPYPIPVNSNEQESVTRPPPYVD